METSPATIPQSKPEVVVVQSRSTGGAGGVLALLLGLGFLGFGSVYAYNKYKDNKDEKERDKQNNASENSSDPDYQTASALVNLFRLPWGTLLLNDSQKAEFKSYYNQIKDPKKVREYYAAISKGRSLDDDINKYINAKDIANSNKVVEANNSKYSTWKVNNENKVVATVKQGDKIVLKPGANMFKVFNYFRLNNGQADYNKISQNINTMYGRNGDKVVSYDPKARYSVYWHTFTQKVYSYDPTRKVNVQKEKAFALILKDGIILGYVDLSEFQRATPLAGFEGLSGIAIMIS